MELKTAHLTTTKSGGAGRFAQIMIQGRTQDVMVDFWTLFWQVGLSFKGYLILLRAIFDRLYSGEVSSGRSISVTKSIWREQNLLTFFQSNFDSVVIYRVTNFLSIRELVSIINLYSSTSIHLVDDAVLTPFCHFISTCKENSTGCLNCPKTGNTRRKRKIGEDFREASKILKELNSQVTFCVGLPDQERRVLQSYWALSEKTEIKVEPVIYKPTHSKTTNKSKIENRKTRLLLASAYPTSRKGFDLIPSFVNELEEQKLDKELEIVICTNLNDDLTRFRPERLKLSFIDYMPLDQFEDLMLGCDIFISLSREDAGPFTVNMALGLGLKVFSFRVGIAPYLQQLGWDVIIIDEINIHSLVQALKIELCR